ncbi:MAG: hypothetical protein Tp156SUR1554471_12 [Prokaryotic dsDNA virus sp.]|nr:MAG: hypothetical protein Tp156SUR1554471_12 [Prokaryotic dsDNA virus sp.]|tara:strand:+ start:359 stop:688 length:330 start_codon:yes stop_codon:yes gene_type:complete
MNLTGKIKAFTDEQKVSEKLTKQQLILTIDEDSQYPQNIAIEFLNDKMDMLKKHQIGDNVSVDINLRGNEYNGKYYNNLVGWRVAKIISNEITNQQQNPERETTVDLPF